MAFLRTLESYNPVVVAIYFLLVAGIAMFCMHPILLGLSLFGALLFFFVQKSRPEGGHGAFVILFLAVVLLNPVISHNGVTVLFVLNHNPVTAEAVFYGVGMATMLVAVLYWFRMFTHMMTSDKLLYLFGLLSPKLALVLSMGLRYVPLFRQQAAKVNQAQTGLGLYKEDNIIDRFRGGLRVFSVMVTWTLENGIITADSMTARGYGVGGRTHFSIFRFQKKDALLLCVVATLFALTCVSLGNGAMDFSYYPAIAWGQVTPWTYVGYFAYGSLVLLPTLMEVEETIKWNYLQSKI